MKEVIVTSLSTGGNGGNDRFTENVSLNFAEVEYAYAPQNSDGSMGADITFNWDIAKNSASA